eukprot:CAMPEP_0196998398 /NCGR_PEP_ID=MMETSP1380-20130617/3810_1 /TAXON_ID=5936 /ORGANISM="Euplotes crassus, Strain CT5" /LENGTH=192 /DNA_ID=CAMNT_0042414965 /DNA_START=358 /DNA_END=936 /DNA_ORIENTATION=+
MQGEETLKSGENAFKYKPPEYKFKKQGILDRPAHKMFKKFVTEKMSGSRTREISSLNEKIKMLENKLRHKDCQIRELEKETTKIIKSKDKAIRKFKEYKDAKNNEEEQKEAEEDEMREALFEALQNYQEGEGEGEIEIDLGIDEDDMEDGGENAEKYKHMLLAMTNQMLSEKLEEQQLDEAIKLSLAAQENA